MKTYTEAEFRTLLNDWNNSKFSFSRMVEMVNERLSTPQEKQPEREMRDWDEVKKKFKESELYDNEPHSDNFPAFALFLQSHYTLPKQITEGKEESIEFAEWIRLNYHQVYSDGKWNKSNVDFSHVTTAELYTLFKTQTEGKEAEG
jgi:hypothetical protein